jgi:hypothetical protein
MDCGAKQLPVCGSEIVIGAMRSGILRCLPHPPLVSVYTRAVGRWGFAFGPFDWRLRRSPMKQVRRAAEAVRVPTHR